MTSSRATSRRGTAKVLASEGCRVAVLARRKKLLDELDK